jgi:peptidoglycan/LPS O-acetylase OafA/YrhL
MEEFPQEAAGSRVDFPRRRSTMKQTRLPELDGIRGCAILLVLVWHYIPADIHAPQPQSVADRVATYLSLTHSGVDLFFVLSGFLIAGILLDNRAAKNYFSVFYARRVCRIFPVYFFLLGLFAVLAAMGSEQWAGLSWLFHDPLPLWSYATFTQNIVMGLWGTTGPHWLGITWSLAVEEQFYLFVPLLIWLLPRRMFAVLALLLIFLAPLLRALWGSGVPSFVWTPWRGDSLLTGALLAVAVRDHTVLGLLRANISVLYTLFLGFLGGAAVLTFRPKAFGQADHTWLAGLYAVFLLLAYVDRGTVIARVLRNRVFVWFGVTSYGLYMYHQAISGLVHGILGGGEPSVDTAAGCGLTVLALVLTLIFAAASYYLIEKRILAWGNRFKYQRESEAQATPKVTVSSEKEPVAV